MPGKNKTSLREIQAADKSIKAFVLSPMEKSVNSFKQVCNKKN